MEIASISKGTQGNVCFFARRVKRDRISSLLLFLLNFLKLLELEYIWKYFHVLYVTWRDVSYLQL